MNKARGSTGKPRAKFRLKCRRRALFRYRSDPGHAVGSAAGFKFGADGQGVEIENGNVIVACDGDERATPAGFHEDSLRSTAQRNPFDLRVRLGVENHDFAAL